MVQNVKFVKSVDVGEEKRNAISQGRPSSSSLRNKVDDESLTAIGLRGEDGFHFIQSG